MMVSLRPKLGFASKTGAHDPASFDENDAKFESVLEFMENHLGRFSKKGRLRSPSCDFFENLTYSNRIRCISLAMI